MIKGLRRSDRRLEISAAESQMLALLKAALWQTPVESDALEWEHADWDTVAVKAIQQTVAPLVMQAALELPGDCLPPKDWCLKAYSLIERNRRTHLLVDGCLAQVVACLREAGIVSVLLKGQACASVYPDPALRQCGDIDLYVGQEQYYNAYRAVERSGLRCDAVFDKDAKHYTCSLRGVQIELHRMAGKLQSADANRFFQEWSSECLGSADSVIEVEGERVVVPSPLFGVTFVFMHLYLHFLNGGIGLRHVCDWMMLLHDYHGEIDTTELASILRSLGILRGWQMFMSMAVRYLGMQQNECLLYTPKYDANSARILDTILKEGNFGRSVRWSVRRAEGYFPRKIHSMRIVTSKMVAKLWIDPLFISRSYCHYLIDGTARVIKEKLG